MKVLNPFHYFNAQSQEEVRNLWANGLLYRGLDVFKFYDTIIDVDVQQRVLRMFDDAQESFLAYLPQEDAFISGWDAWGMKGTFSDYSNEDGSNGAAYVKFKVHSDGSNNILESDSDYEMIYSKGGLYDRLEAEQEESQIIFLRLD